VVVLRGGLHDGAFLSHAVSNQTVVPPTIIAVRTTRKKRHRRGHSNLRQSRAPAWRDIMGGTSLRTTSAATAGSTVSRGRSRNLGDRLEELRSRAVARECFADVTALVGVRPASPFCARPQERALPTCPTERDPSFPLRPRPSNDSSLVRRRAFAAVGCTRY
jgi:hypothetical protein